MSFPRDSTVLVAPDATELHEALRQRGFEVISWPQLAMQPLKTSAALDEAIENLYGYDWIIFVNEDSVKFFLERLRERGRDVSDLDSLRVCAIGERTAFILEKSKVHVDVIASNFTAAAVTGDIAIYAGGGDSLQRLNFLVPQAAIGRDYLKDELEDAGARVDVVYIYSSVADAENTRLLALQTMLQTRSIDAVIFSSRADIESFARVFDTNDLGKLLKTTVVIASDDDARAEGFGISHSLTIRDRSPAEIVDLLTRQLG